MQPLYSSVCATIEEQKITPTNKQALACLRVCQMLSNYYRDIQIFRFDDQTGVVFIFAGEELQIIVPPNGAWRFLDGTQL
jgi:hypothetical protein